MVKGDLDRVPPWHDRISQLLQADLDRRFEALGATPAQFRLLAALARHDSATVRGLAAALRLDGAAVTRLTDRLEAKGLVQRERDPVDARSVTLSLTAEGAALVPLLEAEADAHERAWYGSLSYSELRQYKLAVAKILDHAAIRPGDTWMRKALGSP